MKYKILVFVLLILILIPNLILAEEINDINKVVIYKNPMSDTEKQIEREKQVKEHLKKQNLEVIFRNGSIHPLDDPSDYRHEWGPTRITTAEGYAGNQPSKGIKFPTGGGFWYSESGGPTVSVSISFPSPYNSISFSVNLGNKGTSGLFVEVPNTTDYFKLYVEKEYEVTPYIIYKKVWNERIWDYEWVEWSRGYTKIHIGTIAYALKVR